MKQLILYLIVALCCTLETATAQSTHTRRKKHAPTEAKGKAPARHTPTKKAQPAQPRHKRGQKPAPQRKKGTPRQKPAAQQPKYTATKEIKGLQQENQRIKQEIKQHEAEYQEKQRDVDNRLKRIITLDTEIGQHQRDIDHITHDIDGIDNNIGILKSQLENLELQLGERRARFIRSMRYMARHRSIQDKLMFIFSAKSLSQMYRRLRFVREYAAYQRAQGEKLQQQQQQIDEKRAQLGQIRQQKNNLRYKGRQAQAAVTQKKAEQESVVASLKQDQQVLQGVITERRKKQQALDAQIDRLINIEIQKARERAAAEAKKRAAERAAQAKARAEALARKRAAAQKAAEENARRVAEANAERRRRSDAQQRQSAKPGRKPRRQNGSTSGPKKRLEQPPGHKTVPRRSSAHAKLNNNERRRRSRSSGPSNRPGRQRPTVRQQSARPQPRSSAMIATSARNSSELMQPTMPTFHQRIGR